MAVASKIKNRVENAISFSTRKFVRLKETRPPFKWFTRRPSPGVNLAGYLRAEMGLGQAARGIASALEAVQIPFGIVNFEYRNPARHSDLSWAHKESTTAAYDITVLGINPDNIFNARSRLPEKLFANRYVIAYWFWELSEIPDSWLPAFALVDEVWAATRFVQDALSLKSPVPVTRIPPVVQLSDANGFLRSHFKLPPEPFLFLTVFDMNSVLERKNPAGVIAAFQKAFRSDDHTVGLVIKVTGPEMLRPRWNVLREQIRGYENIVLIDRMLTRLEMNSLLAVTDCFVSLHRSEGFGLIPAEAMSLGKPVILTNWSGNTDYMTPDNSIGIDYQLVELGRDYGPYRADQRWAEPDLDQAAAAMQRLSKDPEWAAAIGRRGQQTIQENYSASTVGMAIQKQLNFIRHNRR